MQMCIIQIIVIVNNRNDIEKITILHVDVTILSISWLIKCSLKRLEKEETRFPPLRRK